MIGVLTERIQFNQQSIFLLKNFNELNQTNSCCIFCNEMHHRPVDIHFNIMQQIQSYSFEGTLVTDSILLAQNLHYNKEAEKNSTAGKGGKAFSSGISAAEERSGCIEF